MKVELKKIIASLAIGLTLGLLVGCGVRAKSEQERPLKIWWENENDAYQTLCVVDEKTGVNYVVVAGQLSNSVESIAICPRYNADGSLYTGK